MRTNEYLYILKNNFGDDLKIDSTEAGTEWDTTYYQVHIWLESELVEALQKEPKTPKGWPRVQEYKEAGIAACLDMRQVTTADTLDEAIKDFFYSMFEAGRLK